MVEDLSPLFQRFGLSGPVHIETNEHAYEVQTRVEDNWLYAAFCAFQRLQKVLQAEKRGVKRFVTVGTGPGLDALGAWQFFHPQLTVMTDIHPQVLPLAAGNFVRNVPEGTAHRVVEGNLLEPFLGESFCADLIYANLPNLPSATSLSDGQKSASFYSAESLPARGDIQFYRLAMQVAILEQAQRCLEPRGSLLLNFGARVPLSLLRYEIERRGFAYQELFTGVKRQTQAGEVLPGYARAEKEHGVEFDFYFFEEPALADAYIDFEGTAELLKAELFPFRLSAQNALQVHQAGKSVHHLVQVLRALKA